MATNSLKWLALLGGVALGSATMAVAQDSGPLIDTLVKKGYLTDQEGEDLRVEMLKDFGGSSAGKLDISSNITKLKIYGDARVRYQYDNEINNGSTVNSNDRGRFRYRVRFGATADLGPKWSSGFRFETAGGATSTNADFGDNFAKEANDTAYFGQAFITFKDSDILGSDSFQADFGKFAHKFFNPGVNGFWIDSDINFEGFAQEIVYGVGSKGKLSLRTGQFVLNANSASAADSAISPSLLHIDQAEFSYGGFTIAPAVVFYGAPSDHDATNTTAILRQNDSTNFTDLLTVLVPLEYKFNIGSVPSSVYATYGYNLRSEERVRRLTNSTLIDDDASMYNVGLKYGNPKNAGEYGLTAEYRHVGNGSYTSLLLDSDFNAGRLNGEGFILSATYNWSAAVSSTISYFNSFNINEGLATNQNSNGQGSGTAEVFQIDLSAKF